MAEVLSFNDKSFFNNKAKVKQQNFYFHAFTNALDVVLCLNSAIILDSTYGVFYNNRGLYYYRLYDDEKAIADFEKAVQLDNNHVHYTNLAMGYYAANRRAEACKAFTHARKLGLNMKDFDYQPELSSLQNLCK